MPFLKVHEITKHNITVFLIIPAVWKWSKMVPGTVLPYKPEQHHYQAVNNITAFILNLTTS